MSMTTQQILSDLKILVGTIGPLLPPGAALAVTVALNALQAVKTAQNGGKDVTPEQLAALFAADDQAKADDLLAQQQASSRSVP